VRARNGRAGVGGAGDKRERDLAQARTGARTFSGCTGVSGRARKHLGVRVYRARKHAGVNRGRI
jgi:hypothetical protein